MLRNTSRAGKAVARPGGAGAVTGTAGATCQRHLLAPLTSIMQTNFQEATRTTTSSVPLVLAHADFDEKKRSWYMPAAGEPQLARLAERRIAEDLTRYALQQQRTVAPRAMSPLAMSLLEPDPEPVQRPSVQQGVYGELTELYDDLLSGLSPLARLPVQAGLEWVVSQAVYRMTPGVDLSELDIDGLVQQWWTDHELPIQSEEGKALFHRAAERLPDKVAGKLTETPIGTAAEAGGNWAGRKLALKAFLLAVKAFSAYLDRAWGVDSGIEDDIQPDTPPGQ